MSVDRIKEIINKNNEKPINEVIKLSQKDMQTLMSYGEKERAKIFKAITKADIHSQNAQKSYDDFFNSDKADVNNTEQGQQIDGDDVFKKNFDSISNEEEVKEFFVELHKILSAMQIRSLYRFSDVKVNRAKDSIYVFLTHDSGNKYSSESNEFEFDIQPEGHGKGRVNNIVMDWVHTQTPAQTHNMYTMLKQNQKVTSIVRIDEQSNIITCK